MSNISINTEWKEYSYKQDTSLQSYSLKLKQESPKEALNRLSKDINCYVKELDLTHNSYGLDPKPDPWNLTQWKDWEFCQGNYRKIYSIDTNIPRKELYIVNSLLEQINAEYTPNHFILVDKLPIVFEKNDKYNSLTFNVYDTKSTITREYTVQYKELKNNKIRVLNGFRTRTVLEDSVLQTGYNIDQYNQLGRKYESYYMSMDRPKYFPYPLNPNTYSASNVPSNLYMDTENIPEKSGTFKAYLFNN
jgi:hypothetical protein